MYFRNYPKVPYRFGNEEFNIRYPNISIYVDVVDQVRQNLPFYKEVFIPDGERPDTLSYRIYGQSEYYWTFFLLNPQLKEQGWPLDQRDVREFVRKKYPYTTFTTSDMTSIYTDFKVGQSISTQSGEVVKVVDRNLDLGQIVTEIVSGNNTGTLARLTDEPGKTFTVEGQSEQYLSTHHYEDNDGNWVDINPEDPAPSILVNVSWLEYYQRINFNNRQINVIKEDVVASIARDFKRKALS